MSEAADVMLRARQAAGLSQRATAARAGVRQPLISRIETGREQPAVATLSRLVSACGYALRVELDQAPDPGDLALLESTLPLTAEQRIDRLLVLNRVAGELRQAVSAATHRGNG
jgi:transcriptional regulator with XRE-family HTH domain